MLPINFTDKSVVVSGGGTGIGFEIAKSFANLGAFVIITGRRIDILEDAKQKIINEVSVSQDKIVCFKCDMSKDKDVEKVFIEINSKFERLDILINNCGTWSLEEIDKIKTNELDYHFNNILKSTVICTKLYSIYSKKPGVIINIGSFSGLLGMKNGSIYSSLKSAINSFTKSSAAELGLKKIRVNCVIPGVIRTPMTSEYIDRNYRKIIDPIALGKVGECVDIANAVIFLSSDFASYITGSILEVTGGKYLTQL